ncbi:MAG: outer membrane protein assembly factor BamD [Candidatus Omnitrophica bacterium]|nr:outer membrane protein assembly factor BamD [Candidatus Omnitrophota bacterium]
MTKSLKLIAIFTSLMFSLSSPTFAYWVWSPEQGKFINPQNAQDNAAEEQFNYSMQFYKGKNFKRAEDEFKNLTKRFPKSDAAAEALFYLGQIHEERGEYFKAFKDYQKIISDYPQTQRVDEVVERQFRIGDMFLTGKKEKLLGLAVKPSLTHAIEIFQKIVDTSPYSAYGDQAQFRLAQAYRMKREWQKSGEEYQKLIDNYPDSNLVDDAKFQMAESIALQASKPDRDQRGLETASKNFEQFLHEYPNSALAEKAGKLKEAINLKAAEKNFKIGEYYEKDSYYDSALVYYEDVATTYPGTDWAKRATEKIEKLRDPEKFLKQRAGLIEAKQRDIEQRERGIAEKESQLRTQKDVELEKKLGEEKKKIKELKKSIESEALRFEKNKKESIKLRRKALDRDKAERKRKEKVLAEKRKLLKKNQSKSLQSALDRWADSLESERYSLYRQETELVKLEEQFGIRSGLPGVFKFVPFVKNAAAMDSVIRYKYKDFSELIERRNKIEKKKTRLITERQHFQSRMIASGPWNASTMKKNEDLWRKIKADDLSLAALEESLNQEMAELAKLTEKRNDLENQIKKLSGSVISKMGGAVTVPVTLAAMPAGFVGGAIGQINPFKPGTRVSESEQFIELLREKENLGKQIEETKGIVQSIQTAFEDELASDIAAVAKDSKSETVKVEKNQVIPQESEETAPVSQNAVKLTPEERKERIELKKKIKQTEKEIRRRCEEIEDRKEAKNRKMDALAKLFKERQNRSLLGPVGGTLKGTASVFRGFLFGLKNEEIEMSKEAKGVEQKGGEDARQAAELRESIELDNIMIEARGREIETLKNDLNALKEKSKTLEGFSFRSILIDRPGNAIGETVEETSKIIPKKDKKSVLIHRLDMETRKLAEFEARLAQVDEVIKTKTIEAKEAEKKAVENQVTVPEVPTAAPFSPPANATPKQPDY